MEEVARQAVYTKATDAEMSILPRYVRGTTTWLSILHRYEHLLLFDVLLGRCIEHRNGDKSTVHGTGEELRSGSSFYSNVAVSSGCIMRSGAHYAEFQITGAPFIGVVRPMPGLDASAYREEFEYFDYGFYPEFLAQKSADWGNGNVHVCEYYCGDGQMRWNDWRHDPGWEDWEGMEGCQSGNTVGMLLNLDEGTLAVYINNRRLGVMEDGLSGSYCWYTRLSYDQRVTIRRGNLPRHEM